MSPAQYIGMLHSLLSKVFKKSAVNYIFSCGCGVAVCTLWVTMSGGGARTKFLIITSGLLLTYTISSIP